MKFYLLFVIFIPLIAENISESLILEAQESLERAVAYLKVNRNDNNSWGDYGGNIAYTSLVISALINDKKVDKDIIKKSAIYVANFAQKDGGIYNIQQPRYIQYTTSLALVALYLVDSHKYMKICLKARQFLKKSQFLDKHNFGGIGYGSDKTQADLSNTQFALEALYLTEDLEKEGINPKDKQLTSLCWERAKVFLTRCQKIAENKQKWVKENSYSEDNGGAIYSPKMSKVSSEDGTLRTYGSMSYALLKSMIYAKLDPKDVRVVSILSWVSNNYTVDENPNLGQKGYYYYLNTFAKALYISNQNFIIDQFGKKKNWRKDIIIKLISLQKAEGYWQNSEGRWQESNPILVTAFSVISLRYALDKYKKM